MHSLLTSSLLATSLTLFAPVSAVFNPSAQTNLGVYWGQNAQDAGETVATDKAQQSLATYCANTNIDLIALSFLTKVNGLGGQPETNFANLDCWLKFDGTNLGDCTSTIGPDIATCQQKYGKTILLSIGGATSTENGFPNSNAAGAAAQKVWDTFGPYNPASTALRPFGNVSVDGFDVDIEIPTNNYVAFINTIRSFMDANKSKKWFTTAAPQCPFPDKNIGALLNGSFFDAIFIQEYSSANCDVRAFDNKATTQTKFNFQAWDTWAKNTSKNKAVKIFMSIVGGPAPPKSGEDTKIYKGSADMEPIIKYCKKFSSFGGIMLWDVSRAYSHASATIVPNLKNKLLTVTKRSLIKSRLFRLE